MSRDGGLALPSGDVRGSGDMVEGGRMALDNKTSLLNTQPPRAFSGPRAREYNPYPYADTINTYDKTALKEAVFDDDMDQLRDGLYPLTSAVTLQALVYLCMAGALRYVPACACVVYYIASELRLGMKYPLFLCPSRTSSVDTEKKCYIAVLVLVCLGFPVNYSLKHPHASVGTLLWDLPLFMAAMPHSTACCY